MFSKTGDPLEVIIFLLYTDIRQSVLSVFALILFAAEMYSNSTAYNFKMYFSEGGPRLNNILLGKTIKAMYKLSGKTLTQLSEETDLTVDTINNLFYARIQKPGFAGVSAMVRATGFSIADLTGFMEQAEALPEDTDFTEAFTSYISSVKDTVPAAGHTVKETAGHAKQASSSLPSHFEEELTALASSYEKQLEQLRGTQLQYVEQLNLQHREQIEELKNSANNLKAHFDHSVGEIKKTHAAEMERQDELIRQHKKTILYLCIALGVAVIAIILLALLQG